MDTVSIPIQSVRGTGPVEHEIDRGVGKERETSTASRIGRALRNPQAGLKRWCASGQVRLTLLWLKRAPKRYYLYLVLLLLPLFLPLWSGPRPRCFELQGDSETMGRQFGRKALVAVRLLCRVYIRGFICHNDGGVYQERIGKALSLRPQIAPVYRREIEALAEAAGVDPAAILLGNSFIDLGYSACGCRAVVLNTGKHLLHAHNLDWDSIGGLANWSISIIRRTPGDGRFRTVSVGLPGMVGSLDIINEHGIALSLNQVGYGDGTPVEPVFIKMRRIAEHCATFAEARDEILKATPNMPFILTLSSAAERLAAVYEPMTGIVRERLPRNGCIAADNVTWGKDSSRSRVCKAVQVAGATSVEDLRGLLRHPEIMLDCNIYSVIFDYAGNRLHLASGRIPAAAATFRSYPLFTE